MNNTNSAGSYSLGNTNNVVGVGSAAPKSIMDGIDMGTGTAGNTVTGAAGNTVGTVTGFFSNISWITWLVIIFILAFLGFNIFIYLAKGTQYITNIFTPLLSLFGSTFGNLLGNTTKQVVNTSATGANAGINATAGAITGGINALSATPATVSSTIPPPDSLQTNTLNNALNNATSASANANANASASASASASTYQADDSYSSIQSANSSGKAGWCYIGEERGIRSCSQVGVNDTCMSGDIFPSSEVCVNPTLRA